MGANSGSKDRFRIPFVILFLAALAGPAGPAQEPAAAPGSGRQDRARHPHPHARRGHLVGQHFPARQAPGRFPVLVVRTPYGKSSGHHFGLRSLLRRPRIMFTSSRTPGAGTIPKARSTAMHDETGDGYDTIEWAAAQPWSDGNVGTWAAPTAARTSGWPR